MRDSRIERRLTWILGSPRSGSTWLLNLLAQWEGVAKVDEPGIGLHLGVEVGAVLDFPGRRARVLDFRRESGDYFFSDSSRSSWEGPLRNLLLRRFEAIAARSEQVVIKEPHGAEAADLLLGLLPASRVIFLLRDGRDVIDSELASLSSGGWGLRTLGEQQPITDRLTYVRRRAEAWLSRTRVVEAALADHDPDLQRTVRYEDLIADTPGGLGPLADWLGLDPGLAAAASERLRIDRAKLAPTEFQRAASPGLWRENLSGEEIETIEEVIGPDLRRLGYA